MERADLLQALLDLGEPVPMHPATYQPSDAWAALDRQVRTDRELALLTVAAWAIMERWHQALTLAREPVSGEA